ncbi:hypothetical protein OG369_43015 [Streptomyces sp. NBC_01221]|uniref:hypothetical protein n=1 Tax=Streptomyces sp. NBC_01221 TaxID=2903782 RepID=UPI00225022EC|nr:hypothetical protein [Streptomyces sp. NBC_01221]MCX4792550.1 hypothetical protein [Streptomyces sp. NBC_01221]
MADTKSCCAKETCFDCRFWTEKIRWAADGDQMPGNYSQGPVPVARVNGRHYVVKPMNTTTPHQFLGFGGALWTFLFKDGREITSNDVMTQGEIPAHFRNRLPDNAVIVPQAAPRAKAPFSDFEGLL